MEFIRDRNGVIIMTVEDSGYESQTSNSISANLLYDILQELKELNKEIKKFTKNKEPENGIDALVDFVFRYKQDTEERYGKTTLDKPN